MVKRVIDMTDKLFYKDVRGSEFEAVVTDCKKTENGYEIILDRTYFYPEGGGQPADNGTVGNAFVSDVQDVNGDVVHYTDKAFDVGEQVHGSEDIRLCSSIRASISYRGLFTISSAMIT